MKKILVFLWIVTVVLSGTAEAGILIIANKYVPDSVLTHKDVEEIYLGKRVQWSDRSRIRFVTVKDSRIHKTFLKMYLNRSESKYNIYWKRMVFTGRGIPPKTINTEAEVIDYVAKTSGAIGYISSDEIPRNSESIVKIIKVK